MGIHTFFWASTCVGVNKMVTKKITMVLLENAVLANMMKRFEWARFEKFFQFYMILLRNGCQSTLNMYSAHLTMDDHCHRHNAPSHVTLQEKRCVFSRVFIVGWPKSHREFLLRNGVGKTCLWKKYILLRECIQKHWKKNFWKRTLAFRVAT